MRVLLGLLGLLDPLFGSVLDFIDPLICLLLLLLQRENDVVLFLRLSDGVLIGLLSFLDPLFGSVLDLLDPYI